MQWRGEEGSNKITGAWKAVVATFPVHRKHEVNYAEFPRPEL